MGSVDRQDAAGLVQRDLISNIAQEADANTGMDSSKACSLRSDLLAKARYVANSEAMGTTVQKTTHENFYRGMRW